VVEELSPQTDGEKAVVEGIVNGKTVSRVEIDIPPAKQYAVKKRVVTPGILIDGVLEVQQGITPNEEIVIRGQTMLEDGSRVNVIERLAPLSAN
jgi:multidrug efflux pump subunit AcrA (membrane-fusion protein)